MASQLDASNFDASLGCLISSELDGLAAQLSSVAAIASNERQAILQAAREALLAVLHAKLCRTLVLELNAARLDGLLSGDTPEDRWRHFLRISSEPSFWEGLSGQYPTLRRRVSCIVANRCRATHAFASAWASDRHIVETLGFGPELAGVEFGAGDSHNAGRTVAILTDSQGRRLVYKPRSLAIDHALRSFVASLSDDHSSPLDIDVPEVMDRGAHGWARFVPHRYASADELPSFYTGIGHWLAIMRLLGGSDLHAENLIANGPHPVVVDCETLFTPQVPPTPSGLGAAPDKATALLSGSVLNVGLLPGRGSGLGWRGVDTSALGMLPGQQPRVSQVGLIKAGTDEAYIGMTTVELPVSRNHPSPNPELANHWPRVINGFEEMNATLRRLDRDGQLIERLKVFEDSTVRVVVRATEVYAEIGRMLWHPVSLHREAEARDRATGLLSKMADNVAIAPGEAAVIDAEIDDLMEGDIPYFFTPVRGERLNGPRGTRWLDCPDLLGSAVRAWRDADLDLDKRTIQASLVGAYLNDGWVPSEDTLRPARIDTGALDARRRHLAGRIMRDIAGSAIHGEDGTVTWIAPSLSPAGWAVQPLQADLYNGISGIAVLAAAYLHEVEAGRADEIDGVEPLLQGTLKTLSMAEDKLERQVRNKTLIRPPQVGGYIGLGSQVWARTLLYQIGCKDPDNLHRAEAMAALMSSAASHDAIYDVLGGSAGGIVPLLILSGITGDATHIETACVLADVLARSAACDQRGTFWPGEQWPKGVGGFAHGATGIGWSLAHLARITGEQRHAQLADGAFRFEDSLFLPDEEGWADLRFETPTGPKSAAAWCHGSVGIGLSRVDLDPGFSRPATRHSLRMAANSTWSRGFGWNHTPCHGDVGAWELMELALQHAEAPAGLTRDTLLGLVLGSIEEHGACSGFVRDTVAPGLLPGIGGIAYQLLRMHPETDLPSILVPRPPS
jgi:type 2 lantibiotic biosynthesis protein LanM